MCVYVCFSQLAQSPAVKQASLKATPFIPSVPAGSFIAGNSISCTAIGGKTYVCWYMRWC